MEFKRILSNAVSMAIFSACILSTGTYASDNFDIQAASLSSNNNDVILGNPDSPVTIIEYADYQCPYCVEIYALIEPRLRLEYVYTGKVKMIYRNLQFLGDESIAAAAAAACANDQNQFWAFHDALYNAKKSDFENGGGEDDNFYNRDLFLKLAQEANLKMSTFTNCIDQNKHVDEIKSETDAASSMGIDRTPMIFVNDEEVTNPTSYSAIKAVIDKKLQKVKSK